MKVLHVSNIPSHHQIPLGKAMIDILGKGNYYFAFTGNSNIDRKKNGWNLDVNYEWILQPNSSSEDQKQYLMAWREFDLVLTGEQLLDLISERLNNKRLTFYMSERWWKPPIGKLRLLHPLFAKKMLRFRYLSKNESFYYLAIGKYAYYDLKLFTCFNKRTLSWGYFTERPPQTDVRTYHQGKAIKILWMGRMLDWKQVDKVIHACEYLNGKGIPFNLTLIGDGPEKQKLMSLAKQKLSVGSYEFNDFLKSEYVYEEMRCHDIYIMPSNGYEGWGAVVNEAMSVGLCVVASNKIGSACSLIDNEENGFLFDPDNQVKLNSIIEKVSQSPELINKIKQNAITKINKLWSPLVAAKRLIQMSNELIQHQDATSYEIGPLSSWGTKSNDC
ncbi:MAG: hypothetical protein COW40_00120 [Cytophagales bacterium CG17_big_fil_post_rev_8_21_14_2_50_40_13]|nr:MAG: hypothetical protein COW40_00120 [Cytophagales bacterium CG17_big_fil_post_rev_8_21_14_2_50_40_13]